MTIKVNSALANHFMVMIREAIVDPANDDATALTADLAALFTKIERRDQLTYVVALAGVIAELREDEHDNPLRHRRSRVPRPGRREDGEA
jgi:hypothetical protein